MGKKSKTRPVRKVEAYNKASMSINGVNINKKDDEYKPKDPFDLFENSTARAAYSALSDDHKEMYRKWGLHMFGTIDFEDSRVLKALPPPMEESVGYIIAGLKSGLQMQDMDENEIALMKDVYGDEWYKKFDLECETNNTSESSLETNKNSPK